MTPQFFAALSAGVGAALGSFINVLVLRAGTGRSAVAGRSRCMNCGAVLRPGDMVPVFSYVFLRGKCRHCRRYISLQYPLVEAAAAALAVLTYLAHPQFLVFIFWFLIWMVLLFIAVYDARYKIIPPWGSVILGVCALGFAALNGTFFSGVLLSSPLFLASLLSRGRAMGWGDGVLEISLGWLLGLSAGLTALMFAFWSGAVVGIALLLSSKRPASPKTPSRGGYTMKSEVPLAPFLILGAAAAHFLHVDFFPSLPLLFS